MTNHLAHSNVNNNPDTSITATAAAISHIQQCLQEKNDAQPIVRFGVRKNGCSGYAYVLDFIAAPGEDDYIFNLTNTIQVAVDRQSFPFVKGTCLDYQTGSFGGVMKFLNPNEKASCGCGESFSLEPEKE